MSDKMCCEVCKGRGYYEVLINGNDDKKETITCKTCEGTGIRYQMTDEEERDYFEDYW